MTAADTQIQNALGTQFAEFQKLALMAKEQPATRLYAEARMKAMLEAMPEATRRVLAQGLWATKSYKSQRRGR